MWRKIWIVLLVFGALRGACREHDATSSQDWQPSTKGLPRLPRASLLVGVSPFFLKITREDEMFPLLPEPGEPEQSGDQSPIYPSISRDGKMVAFAGLRRGGPGRRVAISTYSLIDGKRTAYAEGNYAGAVAISPDASKLAFSAAKKEENGDGDNHLHIIDLRTGAETLGPEVPGFAWVIASWSPDSRRLAYDFDGEVRVWEADTGKVTKIADGGAPSWSPSGEWIAYYPGYPDVETSRILKRPIFRRGLWATRLLVVHPDGNGGKTLFAFPDFADKRRTPRAFIESPVWSPDSQTILMNELTNRREEGGVDIHMLDLKTLKLKTIFKNTTFVLGWGEAGRQ